MANVDLLKATFIAGGPVGLSEMQPGDTIPKVKLEPLVVADVSGAQPSAIPMGANAIQSTAMDAALRGLDGLVMPNVKGYLTNTPPGSPADGGCYIIGAAPTGAWAGQGGKVTRYSTVAAAWEFFTPKNGWTLQSNSVRESYRYTGSAWEIFYQEGTWTPNWRGLTTPGVQTYSIQQGYFTKNGRECVARFYVVLTGVDAARAGNLIIDGLPFAASSSPNSRSAVNIGYWSNVDVAAGYSQLGAQIIPGVSYIVFTNSGDLIAGRTAQASDLQATSASLGTVSYML